MVWCLSIHMSLSAWTHSSKPSTAHIHPAAAGLLLWALQTGYIDLLLQQQQVNAGSATLSVYVGSWMQTCCICQLLYSAIVSVLPVAIMCMKNRLHASIGIEMLWLAWL